MRKIEISYFKYSLILAIFLSVITFVASLLSPIIDIRLIYRFFYYSSLNFVVLLALAFFANWTRGFVGQKVKKTIFIAITMIYSFFYLVSSFTFISTLQALEIQSLLFIYQVKPFTTVFLFFSLLCLGLFFFTFLFYKGFKFLLIKPKKRFSMRVIFAISVAVFLLCYFVIYSILGVFNPIVVMYTEGDVVYFNVPPVEGEVLINEASKLDEPNVIFILVDSVSFDRPSYAGYPRNVTPNLDLLASKSILFRNAYTTATHSDYAQPGFLSSRYMLSNDYRNFFDSKYERVFVWDLFKDRNYSTGYISSQDDLWAGMNKYYDFSALDFYSHSLTDGKTDYGGGLEKKDHDHKTMDEGLRWMGERKNESNSFFLYLNFQAPHKPLEFPEEYEHSWNDSHFYSREVDRNDNAIEYVDLQIGRLVDYLEETNQTENTVIIFSADHGHDWYKRHYISDHGKSVYDEELRVPMMFYFPDLEPIEVKEKVSHIDVLPTVFSLLNFNYSSDDFIGKPMETNRRFFFYAQSHKYLIGMMKGDIKTIIDLNRNLVEVYDIEKDPKEKHNLVYSKKYDNQILELLMWHHCQLNYFSVEEPSRDLEFYCESFN